MSTNKLSNPLRQVLFVLMLLAQVSVAYAEESPSITIIIDDMGNHQAQGLAALELLGDVTYAFLPHTPYAVTLAEKAHNLGKEVMLHMPMDARDGNALGPGALTLHMTETQFKQALWKNLSAVPHVIGLNNHMGSLLTRHPGAMGWMMQALRQRPGLYFIDSRTTRETVAQNLALEYGIPNTRRDVFLDNERTTGAIEGQFSLLLERARKQGYAVGIGHPYPQTIQILRRLLSHLKSNNIRLISASSMIELQQRRKTWPEPSSLSLKVAKSSKP
ncbi:MAG: divergent polysaccharide deacetylase family protein [Gammaproteobacteria bacterium]|nr:divergent polysaccharide deacetylase family protein [Gammaproteobacteria bacterium]